MFVGNCCPPTGESVLLAWMSAHAAHAFPDAPGHRGRVTNFGPDLQSGVALFALLANHWPSAATRRNMLVLLPTSKAELHSNAVLVRGRRFVVLACTAGTTPCLWDATPCKKTALAQNVSGSPTWLSGVQGHARSWPGVRGGACGHRAR